MMEQEIQYWGYYVGKSLIRLVGKLIMWLLHVSVTVCHLT